MRFIFSRFPSGLMAGVLLMMTAGAASGLELSAEAVDFVPAFPRQSQIWSGTLIRRPGQVTPERERGLRESHEKLIRQFDEIHDPKLREENKAKAEAELQKLLAGEPEETTFTLSVTEEGCVWQVQRPNESGVLTVAFLPGYTDLLTVEPPRPNVALGVQRTAPRASFDFDRIPWILDLERLAKNFSRLETEHHDGLVIFTLTGRNEDPSGAWPDLGAIRLTYNPALSRQYPVRVEELNIYADPPSVFRMTTVTLTRENDSSEALPKMVEIVTQRPDGTVHLESTIRIEKIDFSAPVDLASLTRWPEGSSITDFRFNPQEPFQYRFRSDLTEGEIARLASEHYQGNLRTESADQGRSSSRARYLAVGIVLLAVATVGFLRMRRGA